VIKFVETKLKIMKEIHLTDCYDREYKVVYRTELDQIDLPNGRFMMDVLYFVEEVWYRGRNLINKVSHKEVIREITHNE
jgi:hypothetical protein